MSRKVDRDGFGSRENGKWLENRELQEFTRQGLVAKPSMGTND